MPFEKGKPRASNAGRRAGVPNKASATVRERLALMECDHIGYLIATIDNNVPCRVCRGKGKTMYQAGSDGKVRTCQSCWGDGKERIEPKEARASACELLKYTHQQLKAVELTGADGGPIVIKRDPDLALLTDEELLTAQRLQAKALGA